MYNKKLSFKKHDNFNFKKLEARLSDNLTLSFQKDIKIKTFFKYEFYFYTFKTKEKTILKRSNVFFTLS